MCDKLKTLGQTLGSTFQQRYDRTDIAHTHDRESHDIRPQDSASNVDSRHSQTSLTPSELTRKQIDLELEREKPRAEFNLQIRLAELQAKEKRLALSNPGSLISGSSQYTRDRSRIC